MEGTNYKKNAKRNYLPALIFFPVLHHIDMVSKGVLDEGRDPRW